MKSSRQIDTENKVNQAYEYAVSFYNKNNRGLENQLICLKEMMSLTGFDDKTCVQIQNPILALYSASDIIDLSHETIRQHMNITSQNILSRLNEVTSMSELQSFSKTDYKELIKRTSNPQHGYLVPDKVIDMSSSSLKDGDIGVLVEHLQYQQLNLYKFDVSKNFIGDPSVGNLFYTFRLGSPTATYNIKYMNLSNNYISDEGANCMAYHIGAGSHPYLRVLDVSGNDLSWEGNAKIAKMVQNVTQDIKVLINRVLSVNTIIDGGKKQSDLFFGSKEEKHAIIKDYLKQAQSNGVDVKNIAVSKNIFTNTINNLKLAGNFTFGFAKCNVVPEDATSFAMGAIIAKTSKKATGVLTVTEAVACYFETFDESASSQEGVQYMLDAGYITQTDLLGNVE